ncbi:MAG: acyl-CoA thioesterase [Chitinophagaceae bacterium]|nr:acyl-CoA thioesterase [Oligoflexus sp.]
MFSARASVRIPFHDIDVMHIAWHGHYLKYFEIARTALMQSLGLDWPELKTQGIAMPVVDAQTHYRKPIVYGQEIIVEATIAEISFPELIVQYKIMANDGSADILSTGRTRQTYMNFADHTSYFLVPDFVNLRFQTALAQGRQHHETP